MEQFYTKPNFAEAALFQIPGILCRLNSQTTIYIKSFIREPIWFILQTTLVAIAQAQRQFQKSASIPESDILPHPMGVAWFELNVPEPLITTLLETGGNNFDLVELIFNNKNTFSEFKCMYSMDL